MKAGSNCEHTHHVKRQASNYGDPAYAGPDDQKTGQMQEEKLRAYEVIEFILIECAISIV